MRKIALLVGITDYPTAPLRGPLNDVVDTGIFLMEKRGFLETEIICLTNQQATAEIILLYLNTIVDLLMPGDFGFWLFTGHGVLFPTLNGLDEALCAYGFDWTSATTIKDEQIQTAMKRLRLGADFVAVFDCCHSRGLGKTFPVTPGAQWAQDAQKDLPEAQEEVLVPAFITACQSDQTARDVYFDGRYNGALTYFLLKALRELPCETPIVMIVDYINKLLHQNEIRQEAQAYGIQSSNYFLNVPMSI